VARTEEDEQDFTRKQRREQARTRGHEVEQTQAESGRRPTRHTPLAIVVAVVIAIIIGVLVVAGGGGKEHSPTRPTGGSQPVTEVAALLGGIPENGVTLGSPSAPVTLQYFGDLECSVCRRFTLGALTALIHNDVRSGKLRVEYRSLHTATREAETFKSQQLAALAAGKQQRAWYYIELFYHQQGQEGSGYVTERFLQGIAQQVPGLNLSNWQSDRSDPELANAIVSDARAAKNNGFTGTPSFALGKTGAAAKKFEAVSYTDAAPFETAIEHLAKS
jgi:protein-disulfide isomerase